MNSFPYFNYLMGCLVKMKNSKSQTNNGKVLKREGEKKAKSKVKIFPAPTALDIDTHSLEYYMSSGKYCI